MANLKTDSPLSRRIVRAFFDFLDSVQPAPGVDLEGLDVARECLNEVFKIDSTAADDSIKPGLLIDLFRSLDGNADQKINSDLSRGPTPVNSPNLSHAQNVGESKDELFGQFCAALEKIHFFKTTPDGNDDPVQLDKATRLFHDALNAMEKAGCQSFNRNSLAETLKSQGNQAMQSKTYPDAIELYSCAISLCENNAVYYCNRAAAYTQIHKYTEAIRDCLKSIEIDPHYSKAYSRLGLAYYAQGNYRDAIDKGFRKALELDPHNESVKENIRVAEQKLKEEQQWTGRDQMNFSGQEPNNEFTSMPFNMNGIPVDFANMFRNMAAQFTGEHPQERQGEDRNVNGSEDPEVRLGGNINLNLGENVPEELRGALRSMMGMFSGAATHGNPQPQDTNTTDGRSPPN
ncbi:heat shock protein 70 (HSP70)-interacting protein, putative [Ricinus communis]|uniref:Heat shock protein 70 (HSP70)-interacting protein, putative n=1 Tax=Ricinus communis TaxID=3988 RepID=B9RJ86_RICCO|nr:heat shock protein 70 (HSP70)-interacting protein, putative [Ricinus communis]